MLDSAKPLVGSGGEEFDLVPSTEGAEEKAERVAKARANLRKRLGLDTQMGQFVDVDGMIVDDDLVNEPVGDQGDARVTEETDQAEGGQDAAVILSSRERNRLKRLAKKGLKRKGSEALPSDSKRAKTGSGSNKIKYDTMLCVREVDSISNSL